MTGFAGEFRSIYFWRYCLQMAVRDSPNWSDPSRFGKTVIHPLSSVSFQCSCRVLVVDADCIWGHDTLMCGIGFQPLGLRSWARIAREVELASLFQFQLFEIGADILHYCRSSKALLFRIGSESVA
jgi:hypothetical protein